MKWLFCRKMLYVKQFSWKEVNRRWFYTNMCDSFSFSALTTEMWWEKRHEHCVQLHTSQSVKTNVVSSHFIGLHKRYMNITLWLTEQMCALIFVAYSSESYGSWWEEVCNFETQPGNTWMGLFY